MTNNIDKILSKRDRKKSKKENKKAIKLCDIKLYDVEDEMLEEGTDTESAPETQSSTESQVSAKRTVVSVSAEDDEDETDVDDIEELEDDEDNEVDNSSDEDTDDGHDEEESEDVSDITINKKELSADIDDSKKSLADIFISCLFRLDPIFVHKAVAHMMATDLKNVSVLLFTWYSKQDARKFTTYEESKKRVVEFLRNRSGKFNDEDEITHAVAHWFVNGFLGIRK